jgi:pyruvate/2-oxoglutarate/acetoin dehydrogenase E1 component
MQIEREGSDITLVSFSKMVGFCLKAAEELEKDGISAEVGLPSLSRQTHCNVGSV